MAKVTITIEDHPLANKVKVHAEPSFETMMLMSEHAPNKVTAAHKYATIVLSLLRNMAKASTTHKLVIPKPSMVGKQ